MTTKSADREPIEALVEEIRRAQLPPRPKRRRIREAAGVSLQDGAATLGVTAMTLSRWERDTDPRSRPMAIRYREFLDRLEEIET